MKVIFAESHNLDRPDPVGSHHYIGLFKQAGYNCVWLGPAISPFHIFKPDGPNRRRFELWRKGTAEVNDIKWLVPLALLFYYNLPLLRSLYVGRNQFKFCMPPLRKQLDKAGLSEEADLLWCAGPAAYSLLDLVPHRISCYRLADRLDKFSGIPRNVGELQKDLIRRVDFVLATSRSLWEWARAEREEGVYYLPNGVNKNFFNTSGRKPADFPDDGRPVAVYAGTIDTRFDLDTLRYAIGEEKDIYFLLIGPVTHQTLLPKLRELEARGNFSWLGPRDYSTLPAYLQHCSVGIIPFYLNELTEAVNPIKYYEYLACGLPVAAPPMRELSEMGGPINFYSDREGFRQALHKAIEKKRREGESYTGFAAEHTWEKRFKEVTGIVEKYPNPEGSTGGK